MSYTDKEMQVSTQIAYMNITQDQINGYLKDHNGEYPTIQEIPVCRAEKPTLLTLSPHFSSSYKSPAVTVLSDYCWSDSLCGCCHCSSYLPPSRLHHGSKPHRKCRQADTANRNPWSASLPVPHRLQPFPHTSCFCRYRLPALS